MERAQASSRFCIGEWSAAPDLNTFTRDGRTLRVEPKVMELCVRLARSAGTVVTKGELLDSVWPDVVVGEDALTRAVSELRRALDDDARSPRVIETIPKRGYRLIAPVTYPGEPAPEGSPGGAAPARRGVPVAVAAILAGLAVVVWWTRPAESEEGSSPDVQPALVLVAELEDATGQPELAARAKAIVEEAVGRSRRLVPVPSERLAEVLARMRRDRDAHVDAQMAREIAARDAELVGLVTGHLDRTADGLTVSLELWSGGGDPVGHLAATGQTESALARALGERSSVFDALATTSPKVRRAFPPVTTSSLSALKLFAQAVDVVDENYGSITGPWDTAIGLLREALKLDPDFAMARVWLAMVLQLSDLGRLSYVGGDPEPLETFETLAEESLRQAGGLWDGERLFIEGAAARLLGRSEQALAPLEALLWDGRGLFELRTRLLLADLYYRRGQWPDFVTQKVELARLLPDDFDANVGAAHALVRLDRDLSRAKPYASRGLELMSPAVTQRENSCWSAAWLEHLPVFEAWLAGDLESALAAQRAVTARLPAQTSYLRDALATTNGHFWLTLGRLEDARAAFELVGHVGQREANLSHIADLVDDRAQVVAHLERVGWAHSAAAFALAGLLDRANQILRQGTASEPERLLVGGLESLAAGRLPEGASLLQQAVDLWRGSPNRYFYSASLALGDAWSAAGQPLQAIRVFEEAAAERPAYAPPGLQAGWWIKVQARLVQEYRRAGRSREAGLLEQKVRRLLAHADPDYPWLAALVPPGSSQTGPPAVH